MDGCQVVHVVGDTYSCTGADASLNAVDLFPETVIGTTTEFVDELRVSHYFYC